MLALEAWTDQEGPIVWVAPQAADSARIGACCLLTANEMQSTPVEESQHGMLCILYGSILEDV